MTNQELELKIKEIISKDNYFDMIIAAKEFESEYKTSDFYKETKYALKDVIKEAKLFYAVNTKSIQQKIQAIIDGLNVENLMEVIGSAGDMFATENADIMDILDSFKEVNNNNKN